MNDIDTNNTEIFLKLLGIDIDLDGTDPYVFVSNEELTEDADKLYRKLWEKVESRTKDDGKQTDSEYYDWIPGAYESITEVHPKSFDYLAVIMRDVTVALKGEPAGEDKYTFADPAFNNLPTALTQFREWDGDFADVLRDQYLTPLPGIVHNHGNVSAYLLDRIVTIGHIYARRRKDAHQIATEGLKAVEIWKTTVDPKTLGIIMAFVIAAGTIATGIGGIIAGTAAKAAVALGSSAIVGGTLGGALGNDSEAVPLLSGSIYEIANNIKDAFDKNEQKFEDEYEQLRRCLQTAYNEIEGYLAMEPDATHPILPITPRLGDGDGTVKDGDLEIHA